MVGHHIGQVFCTFLEQMLRSVYFTVHALGLVPAGKSPRAWIVEYLLLSICSEKKLNLSQKISLVK